GRDPCFGRVVVSIAVSSRASPTTQPIHDGLAFDANRSAEVPHPRDLATADGGVHGLGLKPQECGQLIDRQDGTQNIRMLGHGYYSSSDDLLSGAITPLLLTKPTRRLHLPRHERTYVAGSTAPIAILVASTPASLSRLANSRVAFGLDVKLRR